MSATVKLPALPCTICGAESDGIHFGATSCAACAAFFRRSVVLNKEYSCRRKGACFNDKSGRCVCRACRFKKCFENGMDSLLVQTPRNGKLIPLALEHQLTEQYSPEMMELPITSCPSRVTSKPELINKMATAYKQLLHNRAITYCANSLTSFLIDDNAENIKPRPANVANRSHFHRNEVAFSMEYIKSMEPFQQLPPNEKVELFKSFVCIWGGIEGSYRTVKAGGFEKRWLVMPDNSYVELDNLQGYYEGDDVLKVDNETVARLFKPAGDQAMNQIMLPMVLNKMDDAEFVALAAIATWACDPSLSNCSEETKLLGKAARDRLCAELFIYYSSRGVPDPDLRLGNWLLIVSAVLEFARVSLENFRMVKFFDMMNYDKLLDDLFC